MKRNAKGQFLPTTGLSRTKLGQIWRSAIRRVENPTGRNACYKDVSICIEWRESLEVFYSWAVNNGYKEGLSIDRIDRTGDYCPSNCRWVDSVTQAQNRSKTKRSSTGFKGVYKRILRNGVIKYKNTAKTPYYFIVIHNGVRKQKSGFISAEEASKAREEYIELHYKNKVYAN